MTGKRILLGIFLGTFALTMYGKNTDAEIKKLRSDLFKKELELSELGKKITEQEEIVSSYDPKLLTLCKQAFERKINSLHKEAPDQNLTDEEKSEICDSMNKNLDEFIEKLKTLLDPRNKERFLVKEFFNKEDDDTFSHFDLVKFHILRFGIESALLNNLVEQYEDCLRDFDAINDQLEALEKTRSN